MKPLPIKEQIKVLEELLRTWDIWGMCVNLYHILTKYGMQSYEKVSIYIPYFTHYNYLKFHIGAEAVRKKNRRSILG